MTSTGAWPCVGRSRVVQQAIDWIPSSSRSSAAGVLVRASLGGGKTRVLEEIAGALAKDHTLLRVVATSAMTSVPFAAVSHLLPDTVRESDEPIAVVAAWRAVLTASGSARALLVIDDVPLLDIATARMVAALFATGDIDVLAAARSEESLPPPLVEVLLGERTLGVDLPPLGEDDIDTILHLALGGPVDLGVMIALRDRSDGNPLFLRELTRSALDAGALVQVGGVWRLRSDPPGSTRLREVVESRLDAVSAATRPIVELLALCGVVDLDELESIVDLEQLADLEEAGLLQMSARGNRPCASLGHPLHGEAIRMALPSMRARLLLRKHVAWVEANGVAVDALQHAIWRLDAGLEPDVDSLRHGARMAAASLDSPSALRLAEPLFERDPSAESGWLLANALFQIGRWEEAFAAIEQTRALDPPTTMQVDLAVTQATILLWGLGDPDAGLALLATLLEDPSMTPANRQRLTAERSSILVNAGRPGEALDELESAFHADDLQLLLGAAVSYCTALAMAGRTDEAVDAIDRALAVRPATPVSGVAEEDAYYVAKSFALVEAGRLDEAADLSEEHFARAVMAERPLTQFWFSLTLGRSHLCRGAVATAHRFFNSARALALDAGMAGPTRAALAGLVITAAHTQEPALAAAYLDELDGLPPFGFFNVERALAAGWAAVARNDLGAAREALLAGADAAVATGHITSAIWMLHDVSRLGKATLQGPGGIAERIGRLAAGTTSALAAARAAHVRALADDDLEALVSATDAFEALGAVLLAAEAASAAADAARSEGDQRRATQLTARVERLLQSCENASTPGLISSAAAVEPLTEREREIAFLAANGLTGRQIAEQLFLSPRTVNNHLQHVYDKLGTRGRAELRAALGLN